MDRPQEGPQGEAPGRGPREGPMERPQGGTQGEAPGRGLWRGPRRAHGGAHGGAPREGPRERPQVGAPVPPNARSWLGSAASLAVFICLW